jgi:hypothetical protein
VVKDVRRGKTFEVVIKGKTSEVAPKSNTSQMAPKIRRLAQVAAELREGGSFTITRLTTLKSLCEDSKAAAQFALYLAKQTYQNMQAQKCPSHLDAKTWRAYQGLVAKTLDQMEAYVEEPSEQATRALWAVQAEVRGVQNTYKQHQWGPVRVIQSSEVLLVEYALSCLLQPHASAEWSYRIAREYAERYNSRYGTGLIPESAPMVEDIADFWCQYHMGKPLQEWLGAS